MKIFCLAACLFFSLPQYFGQEVAFITIHDDEDKSHVSEIAVDVALKHLSAEGSISFTSKDVTKIKVKGKVPKYTLDKLCATFAQKLKAGKTPLLLDMTSAGVAAETVKGIASTLALPTISTSFGKRGDIKSWHGLSEDSERYLVRISPPADILTEIIRPVVEEHNMTNLAILFGDIFDVVFRVHFGSMVDDLPVRTIARAISGDLKYQLKELSGLGYGNYFIIADTSTIENVLTAADENRYLDKNKWFAATVSHTPVDCDDNEGELLLMYPQPNEKHNETLQKVLDSDPEFKMVPQIDVAFYYDVAVRSFLAVRNMIKDGSWPAASQFHTCESFEGEFARPVYGFDLRSAFQQVDYPFSYAPFLIVLNGESHMEFNCILEKRICRKQGDSDHVIVGNWTAGLETNLVPSKPDALNDLSGAKEYRVVTNEQPPFVIKSYVKGDADQYTGICIDILDIISTALNFKYTIYSVPDGKMGYLDENGEWTGVVNELIERKADIGMTAISVMVERERVIDFTIPYYDPVGISILMKKPPVETSLFKFLTVLEADVWLCILGAYFLTSFLMWIFDRFSPYSYQNNKEKYKDDDEKRIFNLKESLWFCMTSLTPQGGGEAPKNLSGRLVAATWWLFGFIIMASYTANLAAFLTVSRLDTPIESLDDLAKQYKIQYAPVYGSMEMNYFERMAAIENKFYEIWKDMSLNDSLSPLERSKLAVWDYPVSDKFTKMWQAMTESGMPPTLNIALKKVRNSSSSSEGFALLGDAMENLYMYHTNCDLQIIGQEFSRKPYAVALQKDSHLKDSINNVLQDMINSGTLQKIKKKWWDQISIRKTCEELKEEEDGISIKNIGGVFIVIFLGIGFALLTLSLEFSWYKFKRRNDPKLPAEAWTDESIQRNIPGPYAKSFASKFLNPVQMQGGLFARKAHPRQTGNYYKW